MFCWSIPYNLFSCKFRNNEISLKTKPIIKIKKKR